MSHSSSRAHKREQFSNSGRSNSSPKLVIGASVIVLAGLVVYLGLGQRGTAVATVSAAQSNGDVRIPIADVSSGQAKFFDYTASNNKHVRFFVIKSSDGVFRAAADACDVCYRSKMGYHQEGDDLVCNKCGRHFPSKDVNVITGGCNPNGIPQRVEGNTVVIAAAGLEARAGLFQDGQ